MSYGYIVPDGRITALYDVLARSGVVSGTFGRSEGKIDRISNANRGMIDGLSLVRIAPYAVKRARMPDNGVLGVQGILYRVNHRNVLEWRLARSDGIVQNYNEIDIENPKTAIKADRDNIMHNENRDTPTKFVQYEHLQLRHIYPHFQTI